MNAEETTEIFKRVVPPKPFVVHSPPPVMVPRVEEVQESAVFVLGGQPNSFRKMATLKETIKQIKGLNYEVLISTYYALPASVMAVADYVVVSEMMNSGDLSHIKNAIKRCLGKWEWFHYMDFDTEVDLSTYLEKVKQTGKCIVTINNAHMFSGKVKYLDGVFEFLETWKDFHKNTAHNIDMDVKVRTAIDRGRP